MPVFEIAGKITVSCTTKVTAPTREKALEIAATRECAPIQIDPSYPENSAWHLDTDGTPYDLIVDK
ncbi:hypothetical protein V0M98_34860 (plasmid) [Pseudomonas silesiensis]|uniref:hypothetical protein n=1 Tax=Pseudomonas silesiensis TaxID=1853130 RepID=UPI0030D312F2